jgi:hypothetical protein
MMAEFIRIACGFFAGAFLSWATRATPWPKVRTLGRPRCGVLIEFPVRGD